MSRFLHSENTLLDQSMFKRNVAEQQAFQKDDLCQFPGWKQHAYRIPVQVDDIRMIHLYIHHKGQYEEISMSHITIIQLLVRNKNCKHSPAKGIEMLIYSGQISKVHG